MIDKTDVGNPVLQPKRPGPKPSGIPRQEAVRVASKAHRANVIKAGKVELKAFTLPQTKTKITELKAHFNVTTLGEVLDLIIEEFRKETK